MSLTARSWRAALRQANRRTFSSTALSQRHTLPTFEPSSNEELDALLDSARRHIMVPAHLNLEQQQLVYRDKYRARLSVDAPELVWSTVARADVTLEHIDRQRDIPARWSVLSGALRLAETPTDWENVGRLLEGLSDAGVPMKQEWMQVFVRRAARKGAMHAVLRALQRPQRTGMRLRSRDTVSRVMWSVRGIAADNGWGEVETDRALRWAEQVVELMESEEHCGGPKRRVPQLGDLRTLPFVIATPLELAAARALRHKEGVDEDGIVEAYAKRLCANLKNFGLQENVPIKEDFTTDDASAAANAASTENAATTEDAATTTKRSSKTPKYATFAEGAERLRRLVPVWHGLELARRVLKPLKRMPLADVETYRLLTALREGIDASAKLMQAGLAPGKSVELHMDYQMWQQVKNEEL